MRGATVEVMMNGLYLLFCLVSKFIRSAYCRSREKTITRRLILVADSVENQIMKLVVLV